jgi:hypothetical protein
MMKLGVSERRACRVLGQARSTQRRSVEVRGDEDALTRRIVQIASCYGRYDSRPDSPPEHHFDPSQCLLLPTRPPLCYNPTES